MGNEKSLPSDLRIEDIIKTSDYWTQKSATLDNGISQICIFEQCRHSENTEPLEKLSKNLMLHRHPCILKYISSWKTSKMLYVGTEYVLPLAHVLPNLLPMQLCVGLFNILKAITFLHDKALSVHNNLTKDAIYVANDECWKLGQLNLLSRRIGETNNSSFVDQKAFASLVLEILDGKTNDEISAVDEFRELCKTYISAKNPNPQFLQQLFQHPFFKNQFLEIYSFLIELPLKSESEKAEFFITITEKLSSFPEELVARQLGKLLLSRLVLLNNVAQNHLLPNIFNPKDENNPSSLFGKTTIQKYILPRLLIIFSLHDSQIRLILLKHFSSFYMLFTSEQLQRKILPELLLGIKDTNEELVAATLHTLADLVPILGASVVIGNGCSKLFADGRPSVKDGLTASKEYPTERNISPKSTIEFILADRPSPDGGEDPTESSNTTAKENDVEIEITKTNLENGNVSMVYNDEKLIPVTPLPTVELVKKSLPKLDLKKNPQVKYASSLITTEDLNTLDIKCSRSKNDDADDDIEKMFKDMEPVISKTAVVKVTNNENQNKFKVADIESDDGKGWGDEITNWEDLELE